MDQSGTADEGDDGFYWIFIWIPGKVGNLGVLHD